MVFEKPQEAYEVEVLDESGNTKAQCTLCANDLEKIIKMLQYFEKAGR